MNQGYSDAARSTHCCGGSYKIVLGLIVCGVAAPTGALRGQEVPPTEQPTTSLSTDTTATPTPNEMEVGEDVLRPERPRYNIPWGSGGINFSLGLQGQYVDNVYLTHTSPSDDFIIVPECNIAAFIPAGRSNNIVLDLGIAYYYYIQNTELNTGTPLINPNSELAFNLQTGDFHFKFSESFSYQESPVYETGGQFYNIYNTGRFARYLNRVGVAMKWDLHDLVVDASYYHENLAANGSTYNYIDHASELFGADALLAVSPTLTVGLESVASINRFDNSPWYDTWRARVGPGVRLNLSEFVHARLGAGYERIEYDSSFAAPLGLKPEDSYYAYAAIDHEINRFISHSIQAGHDNQLGFNAANLERSYVGYYLNWRPKRSITVSPGISLSFYDESYGSGSASLYSEKFRYLSPNVLVHYEYDRHWRANLGWEYHLKDSDTEELGYSRNLVRLELIYQF